MNEPSKFRFSLANLMLMMLPLAVAFWIARQASGSERWMVWVVVLVIAAGPAIGALVAGWHGMFKGGGLFVVICLHVYAVAMLTGMLAFMMLLVSGQNSAAAQLWSIGVAIGLMCAGPAVAAMVGGWKLARESFSRWCYFLILLFVVMFIAFIGELLTGRLPIR